MALTVAACLLLAALSLLGPSEPSYDPWAWLVWGREIAHLGLNTTGGPSWKPLPVVVTALVAPLSKLDDGIPAALWILVARAGGLLALALAFKVTARIVGGGSVRRVVAGAVAVLAIVLTPGWIRYLFHGNEAPLAIGLALWAVDLHLDGRRRWALGLGVLVCLARPELFGFLLLYGAYLWWRSPASRTLCASLLALVPAAWLLPSWVGSGNPFFAGEQARSEPSWSLSLAPVPWRAALDVAQSQAWLVLELGALVAVALALAGTRRAWSALPRSVHASAAGRQPILPRPAEPGAVAALAGFGLAIVVLFAAMTQAGFSGNVRYVLPALVAIAVLGGVGAGLLVDLGAELGRRARVPNAAAAGAVAASAMLLVALAPELRDHVAAADAETHEAIERSRLHTDLEHAVDGLGAHYVTLFGPATVNRAYQTHLAWELSLPLSDVQGARGRGIAFQAPSGPLTGVIRVYRRAQGRTTLARVGSWTVTGRSAGARHVFTWPIVGFSLRAAAERLRRTCPTATAAGAPGEPSPYWDGACCRWRSGGEPVGLRAGARAAPTPTRARGRPCRSSRVPATA
jgi:hypothetical protein